MDNYYELYDLVSDRLMFTYESYGEICDDNKSKFLSGYEIIENHWIKENLIESRIPLALADLETRTEIKNGDEGEQYVSYDYQFMLGIMGDIGNSTQSTYFSIGVVNEDIIDLVMDNAGGNEDK